MRDGRLVEDEQVGVADERDREPHALASGRPRASGVRRSAISRDPGELEHLVDVERGRVERRHHRDQLAHATGRGSARRSGASRRPRRRRRRRAGVAPNSDDGAGVGRRAGRAACRSSSTCRRRWGRAARRSRRRAIESRSRAPRHGRPLVRDLASPSARYRPPRWHSAWDGSDPGRGRRPLTSASASRPARELPQRPERRPARGGDDDRGAAARARRRRLRQDARPHLPHRPPARRRRRRSRTRSSRSPSRTRPPARCASASRTLVGPPRARDLGHDLPRRLRPHPAPRGRAARLHARTSRSTTRPTRSGSSGSASRSSSATRSASPRAASTSQISNAKNQLIGPDEYAAAGRSFYDQTVADVYELYQQRLFALERGRLRRPAHARRSSCSSASPRRAEHWQKRVPLRARRRVPGHEPRAVPAAQAARGAATAT